jgi:uncharacterized membrane protein YfbV (UPF0208 family)
VSTQRIVRAAAFALSALPAQQAVACAVCFSGRDESRVAYLLTAIFMTLIPIAVLGAGIYWVVKKATAPDSAPPR